MTVLTPTTVNVVGLTPITLLIEGNVCPDLLYLTKSPVVTIPEKLLPALVISALPLGKVALMMLNQQFHYQKLKLF